MTDLFYTDHGSGFPVVFIHGFCESHIIWDDFTSHFEKDYRVICPDLPGFGKSQMPIDPEFSLNDIAFILDNWLQDLGIEKCIIIGHSLGGYVTLAMMEEYSHRISGIGLFHSTCYPDSEEKKKTRNKVIAFLEKRGSNEFTDTFVPGLFYRKSEEIQKNIDRLLEDARTFSKEAIIAYTKAMRDRPGRCHLLKKSSSVLFIAGEKDGAVPIEMSRQQTEALDPLYVHFLDETGHMGMYEKKSDTIKMVSDFLKVYAK